jgi:prenylated cyclic peptide (anacyclamide/piricyclamide family)
MKTKKLTPRNAAPVQRENTATVSRARNAIALRSWDFLVRRDFWQPFAGDNPE